MQCSVAVQPVPAALCRGCWSSRMPFGQCDPVNVAKHSRTDGFLQDQLQSAPYPSHSVITDKHGKRTGKRCGMLAFFGDDTPPRAVSHTAEPNPTTNISHDWNNKGRLEGSMLLRLA
ncbi:hypothetical protein JZ751_027290 [Albula glossodonta]|uniref:Uncharacterized protein n=1 Tax=Albula glossodonta TaxID=121402 RepID=A0A8T2N0H2_9TELE|nr:hypothetical protein JZ751_027290 [Albula glossodonta]